MSTESKQFSIFRILFGSYLIWHFASLLPWVGELFGPQGVFPDPSLNATYGHFPNLLNVVSKTELGATQFIGVLIGLSISFTLGFCRRSVSFLLWYGSACLFHRNNLINSVHIDYVGWLLLACAVLPPREYHSLDARAKGINQDWAFPKILFWGGWLILLGGYTASGLNKFSSLSWTEGVAIERIANCFMARDNWIRDTVAGLPSSIIWILSKTCHWIEVLCLPCIFHRNSRLIAWSLMAVMHIGVGSILNFIDLSIALLLFHLFLFEPAWLKLCFKKSSSTAQFDS